MIEAGFLLLALFPISTALTEIGFSLALAGAVLYVASQSHPHWRRTVIDIPLLIFFSVVVISSVSGAYPMKSLVHLKYFRIFLLYYALMYSDIHDAIFRKYLYLFIVAMSIYTSYMIIQHLMGGKAYTELPWMIWHFQIYLERIHPRYAQLMMLALLMAVGLLAFGQPARKPAILLGVCIAVLSMGLYFSYTRSAMIGAVGGILFLGSLRSRSMLFLLIAVFFGFFLVGEWMPSSRLGTLVRSIAHPFDPSNPRYGNNMIRVRMFNDVVDIVKEHPLLGLGYEGYETYAENKYGGSFPDRRISSDVLNILANTGIAGLTSFLILMGSIGLFFIRLFTRSGDERMFGKGARRRILGDIQAGTLGAFCAFIISGLFEPLFFNPLTLKIMLFFIGGTISLSYIGEIHEQKERPA